ncbi:MAG: glucose 1-dehydrogenase [Alphaproteobacteria bacterium]
MGRVEGKVAVITGGAVGLGAEHARTLVREGANVVITDLNETDGQALADKLGENALFIAQNVTEEADWQAVMAKTIEAFGRLDVLVNNAGVVLPGSVEDVSYDDWKKIMTVNVDGTFLGCKYAVGEMKKTGGGSIINISSAAGLRASAGLAAYNTSKAAVAMLTKSVALHAGQFGIRCNSVHPGTVMTPMVKAFVNLAPDPDAAVEDMRVNHALQRLGEPQDIANTILFLASDDSSFATGGEYRIDGGLAL